MELIIILILLVVVLIISYFIFNIHLRKMKQMINDEKLDKIVSKFPENVEICKDVLKMIDNEKVKIKEDNNSKASLYVAISDTIFIGKINNTYTRIQTVCHECLHSIQSRKLLLFNFIYSNIYLFYFAFSIVLTLFGTFKNYIMQVSLLTIMGFLYYIVRSYLETDAMTKAKYLAKDYMLNFIKSNKNFTEKEVEEVDNKYEEINKLGIPAYNYMLFCNCMIKTIVYIIITVIYCQINNIVI